MTWPDWIRSAPSLGQVSRAIEIIGRRRLTSLVCPREIPGRLAGRSVCDGLTIDREAG